MYSTKKLNDFEIEPVKVVEEKKENIMGYEMFSTL